MNWFKKLPPLALALALIACSPWERVADDFPGKVGKGIDHARWTRDARVYGDLETVALVSVTLLSPEVQARLSELIASETPGRDATDVLGFSTAQTDAAAIVILSSHIQEWRRLDASRSPWGLVLDADGVEVPLRSAEKLKPTVAFEWYFPAWNPWSAAWLVTFERPATDLSQTVSMRLSAAGVKKTALAWP